jgi:transcription factor IIIB 90 kDa subunit
MPPPARPRPPRIPSLRNPSSLRSSPAPSQPTRRGVRACPSCSASDIREDNGQLVCFSCGTIVSDSVIVNDVTFGEAPSGAALVQGTTVHEGQRYAKSAGTTFRHGGRTAEDAAEAGLRYAKEEMTRLANSLLISNIVDRAFRLYQMARVHHFHRPVLESVAICLYIVCRQTKGNTTLLIDFAEKIRQNVFDLGSVYKKFVRAIGLEEDMEDIGLIEIEPLLYKFAKRLEFGQATRQVANDAALILSRMDRDWMVTGRQPPALCGAAIILAARMNNFRRSVREVVYVVKAGDATVMKRLWEFRQTKAGRMTVSEFRQNSRRLIDKDALPPSLYTLNPKSRESKSDKDVSQSLTTPAAQSASPAPPSTPQRDQDGFIIPVRPTPKPSGRTRKRTSESLDNEHISEVVSELGGAGDDVPIPKRRKSKMPDPVLPLILTKDDLVAEDQLEDQIRHEVERFNYTDQHYDQAFADARKTLDSEMELQSQRATTSNLDKETIDENEFESDPEVSNCLLTPDEVEVKEKIWVTHNYAWLRLQQERMLDKAMEEASGKKTKRQNRRKSRQSSMANESPASTPAEASHRMLERRNIRPAFSRHINYEKLKKIYGLGDEDNGKRTSTTDSTSRATSEAPSAVARPDNVEEGEVSEEEVEEVEEAEPGADDYYADDYDDGAVSEEVDYDELGLEGNEFDE